MQKSIKLIRVTTVPLSLKYLLRGQMKYMATKGINVIMVSSDGIEIDDVKNFENVPHILIPMTRQITPWQDIKSIILLYRLFKKEKPDIVHSHTPKAGLTAMLAAKLSGVPLRIHTIAGLRFFTTSGFKRKLLIQMEKLTSWAATQVWPNSFSMYTYLLKHSIGNKEKLSVIGRGSSNGIDLSIYNHQNIDEHRIAFIKEKIKFQAGDLVFVFVGRIVADKGVNELVEAFVQIHEKCPQVKLLLVGTFENALDPILPETESVIRNHPCVQVTGWVDDVQNYLALATALIHPSLREGFPNVLLQAGAIHCPIICSKIDGNTDIVSDKKTGLLFEPNNAKSLIERWEYAISHREEMNSWADNLQNEVRDEYSRDRLHEQIFKAYKTILQNNK